MYHSLRRCLYLLFALILYSRAGEKLHIQFISEPVKLDGILNENFWQHSTHLRPFMFMPENGIKPSQKTDIYLAYDDRFVYVGARLWDSNPAKIQDTQKKRDGYNRNSDSFGIVLDSFNDKENGLCFYTTPSGSKLDFSVFNDANGGFPINVDWNGYWDVATSRDGQGWYVEMRIPFSSLRFQSEKGLVDMGFIGWRWIARNNESSIFPAIPNKWGWWSQMKPSMAQPIEFQNVQNKNPLYVTPYALGGFSQQNDLNDAGNKYVASDLLKKNIGLDIKYGITSNLTLDVTINTDFAQVEVDNQQVNLTRFSLFFPEKRVFFQERSSIFNLNFGRRDRLFHSRRIGIRDGTLVPILGGARLIGRIAGWDLGFLEMQADALDSLASENFGVLRLRRQVVNANSYVGTMLTSRLDTKGVFNRAVGIDGLFRFWDDDYLQYAAAQSFENNLKNRVFDLRQLRLNVSWSRRKNAGFSYSLFYGRAGRDYNPGMGFNRRSDFNKYGGRLSFALLPDKESRVLRHDMRIFSSVYYRNSDHMLETTEIEPRYKIEFKSGYTAEIQYKMSFDRLSDTLSLSDDVFIAPGGYHFDELKLGFNTPGGNFFSLNSALRYGSYYDSERLRFDFSPKWTVNSTIELTAGYSLDRMRFKTREQKLTLHIARVKIFANFSTQLSSSILLQYNSAVNGVFTNARLRYNPREGNDLYLIYNANFNTNRYRDVPVMPLSSNRIFLLKYTYTFLM